jgi:hypothetical protein
MVSSTGTDVVAWTRRDANSLYVAELAIRPPRGVWSSNVAVPGIERNGNDCLPQLAFSAGRLVVAWVSGSNPSACSRNTDVLPGSRSQVVVSTLTQSGWNEPAKIFSSPRPVAELKLTVDPSGTAVLAWLQPEFEYVRTSVGAAAFDLAARSTSIRTWR